MTRDLDQPSIKELLADLPDHRLRWAFLSMVAQGVERVRKASHSERRSLREEGAMHSLFALVCQVVAEQDTRDGTQPSRTAVYWEQATRDCPELRDPDFRQLAGLTLPIEPQAEQ